MQSLAFELLDLVFCFGFFFGLEFRVLVDGRMTPERGHSLRPPQRSAVTATKTVGHM